MVAQGAEAAGAGALLVVAASSLLPWATFRFGQHVATRSGISSVAGAAPVAILALAGVACVIVNRQAGSHSFRILECLLAVGCIAYTTSASARLLATGLSSVGAGVGISVAPALWVGLAASLASFVLSIAGLLVAGLSEDDGAVLPSLATSSLAARTAVVGSVVLAVVFVGLLPPWGVFAAG